MPLEHPDVNEGMFVGSELGTSFHCACGWVSEVAKTLDTAQNLAIAHVVKAKYPTFGRRDR